MDCFFNDAVSAQAQRFCDPAEPSLVADSGKQLQRQQRDLRRAASPRYSGFSRFRQETTIQRHQSRSFATRHFDLDWGNISPAKLAVWLHIIAKGRSVVAQESEQRKQFLPGIGLVAAKLHFTETFRTKNAQAFKLFTSLLQSEAANCKWKSIAEPHKDAWLTNGLEDMRSFLLNVQRVPSGSPSGPPSSNNQRANPPRSI